VEVPFVEAPFVEVPLVEAPFVEVPLVEAPFVETPLVEAPFVEAPFEEGSLTIAAPDSPQGPRTISQRNGALGTSRAPKNA